MSYSLYRNSLPLAVHAEFHHHIEQAHFTPLWWSSIDILFLVLSFYAVYLSSKQINLRTVKIGLYGSWIGLAGIIINENFIFSTLQNGGYTYLYCADILASF